MTLTTTTDGIGANAFEATEADWRPLDLRQRIEHAQLLDDAELPRFAAIASFSGCFPIRTTESAVRLSVIAHRRPSLPSPITAMRASAGIGTRSLIP